jgi:hypothetical protein
MKEELKEIVKSVLATTPEPDNNEEATRLIRLVDYLKEDMVIFKREDNRFQACSYNNDTFNKTSKDVKYDYATLLFTTLYPQYQNVDKSQDIDFAPHELVMDKNRDLVILRIIDRVPDSNIGKLESNVLLESQLRVFERMDSTIWLGTRKYLETAILLQDSIEHVYVYLPPIQYGSVEYKLKFMELLDRIEKKIPNTSTVILETLPISSNTIRMIKSGNEADFILLKRIFDRRLDIRNYSK